MKLKYLALLFIAFIFLAPEARAAIAFDNASSIQTLTAQTSSTLAYTVGATANPVLFVCLGSNTAGTTFTVKYAGAAMTLVTSTNINFNSQTVLLYALVNPTTGTNNIVVTSSAALNFFYGAASYTGMNQSVTPDATKATSTNSSVTSSTLTLTTIADNDWTVACTYAKNGNVLAGTGATLRTGTGNSVAMTDSNGPITPAGSTSEKTTFTSSVFGMLMVGWSPASSTVITPRKVDCLFFSSD